ncbi:MAG: DUF192 domain-containing protein [Elusimicrobia bacterium]|nr:DUF192 domain-containing protein [Elusimicrobiota bacterium]
MIVFNRTRGVVVAEKVEKADTPATRAKGLLGRDGLGAGEGVWIVPCSMVHMLFMRFPIDVVFVGRDRRVRRVVEGLKPWRLSPWVLSAESVLELAAGTTRGVLAAGDELEFR